jgi:hypothetical protein
MFLNKGERGLRLGSYTKEGVTDRHDIHTLINITYTTAPVLG